MMVGNNARGSPLNSARWPISLRRARRLWCSHQRLAPPNRHCSPGVTSSRMNNGSIRPRAAATASAGLSMVRRSWRNQTIVVICDQYRCASKSLAWRWLTLAVQHKATSAYFWSRHPEFSSIIGQKYFEKKPASGDPFASCQRIATKLG